MYYTGKHKNTVLHNLVEKEMGERKLVRKEKGRKAGKKWGGKSKRIRHGEDLRHTNLTIS